MMHFLKTISKHSGFTTKRAERSTTVFNRTSEASAGRKTRQGFTTKSAEVSTGGKPRRGFTLLVAVLLSIVALSLSISLIDIAFKQVVLAATARQSSAAFYNADAALECALYADQKQNVFYYNFPGSSGNTALNVVCQGLDVTNYVASQTSNTRTTTYTVPCVANSATNVNAKVTVYKTDGSVSCNGTTATTCVYVTGYNTCNPNDPRSTERGIKVSY
jgi:hypothetical protein